jgi:hypothetical protein
MAPPKALGRILSALIDLAGQDEQVGTPGVDQGSGVNWWRSNIEVCPVGPCVSIQARVFRYGVRVPTLGIGRAIGVRSALEWDR